MTLDTLFADRFTAIVPDVIGSAAAAELRGRLRYARYDLVDRGSYEHADRVDDPALLIALAKLASEKTGRWLAAAKARAIRLSPGDYLLAHHDHVTPAGTVELVLELSAAPVPGASVHVHRDGAVVLVVPCAPGSAAIVERGPNVACSHAYVSKRHAGAEVVRLIVTLR